MMGAATAVRQRGGLAMKAKLLLLLIPGLMSVGLIRSANASAYTLTDLDPLAGYTEGYAYGINDAGEVVGYSTNNNRSRSATIWNGGSPADLGASVGATYNSQASAINNAGQVVGEYGTLGGGGGPLPVPGVQQAVLWNGNSATTLGTLLGWTSSYATATNNAGQVVGESFNYGVNPGSLATIWNNGTPAALGLLPGASTSVATGINNAGQVVGYSGSGGIATIWNSGSPTALGLLTGSYQSYATGINDSGEVMGESFVLADDAWQATIWNNGVPTELGILPGQIGGSYAYGINDAGLVVGHSGDFGPGAAVLWDDGTPINLGTLLDSSGAGWTLENAFAINLVGQIVGVGEDGQGNIQAFLLTPCATCVPVPYSPYSVTPNPASLPLFATGLGMMCLFGWRRKRKDAAPIAAA